MVYTLASASYSPKVALERIHRHGGKMPDGTGVTRTVPCSSSDGSLMTGPLHLANVEGLGLTTS